MDNYRKMYDVTFICKLINNELKLKYIINWFKLIMNSVTI